jgi:hypothetical protein
MSVKTIIRSKKKVGIVLDPHNDIFYVEYSLANSLSFEKAWIIIWIRILVRLYKGDHSCQSTMNLDLNTLLKYWFKKTKFYKNLYLI